MCVDPVLSRCPKLDTFLCFWSVEQGTIFIGYLNMFLFILASISDVLMLVQGGSLSLIFYLIVNLGFALFSFHLVVAVKRGNSRHVYLWIAVSLIWIILNLVAVILSVVIFLIAALFTGVIGTRRRKNAKFLVQNQLKHVDNRSDRGESSGQITKLTPPMDPEGDFPSRNVFGKYIAYSSYTLIIEVWMVEQSITKEKLINYRGRL